MATLVIDPEYAPRDLSLDPGTLGLTRTTAENPLGTATAWSRRTNSTRRATLFLHGAAGSWTTWTPLLGTAEDLGAPIANPVLFDLPGWGSATLTPAGEADIIETICVLVKQCADELGYTEWDLVGHSMGGFVALHMAAIWPECVLSVGTVSPTGRAVIDAARHPLRHFFRLPGFILLWRVMQALAHFRHGGRAAVRMLRRLHLLRFAVRPLFRHPRRIPPGVISALADELRARSFSDSVALVKGYDLESSWRRIECPVRAAQGDRDVFARKADLVELGRIVPASRGCVIPDCGHFALIERPRAVLIALGFVPDESDRSGVHA